MIIIMKLEHAYMKSGWQDMVGGYSYYLVYTVKHSSLLYSIFPDLFTY